jgi:putative membrane protein
MDTPSQATTTNMPDNDTLQEEHDVEKLASVVIASKGESSELTVRRMSKSDTWSNLKRGVNGPTTTKGVQAMETSLFTEEVPSEETILQAITASDRINSLLACDAQVLSYDPRKWNIVLQPRGRNASMIALPLLVVTLWGIMWIFILRLDSMTDVRESIANLNTLISPLLVPVSFLLVFRLGRAAVRFWDARKSIGKLVEICRALMSTAAVGCMENDEEIDMKLLHDFARWTCVFPIAVKNFLRPATRKGWDPTALHTKSRFELGRLVSDEEATEILNTSDENLPTIFVLNKLRVLAWKIGGQKQRDFLYQQLNVHIDTLTGAWGACERINNTPLPQVYVAHLRTFLLLYLLLWQMEAAATYSWIAIPTVFAASWGLLGIEAAAVECECPFKYHSNHLPLGKMCVVTARNVAQTIRNTIQIP